MNLGLSYFAVRKSIFSGRSTSGFATVAQCANHPRGENGDNPVAPATFTLLQLISKKKETQSRLTVDSNARDRNLSSKWLDWLVGLGEKSKIKIKTWALGF